MLPGICAYFGAPVWCYSAVVQRFSAKKNFFDARRFFYHGFFVAVWGEDLPQIFTDFFVADFTTDFHGFWARIFTVFYGGGGIILGSMSEKIV